MTKRIFWWETFLTNHQSFSTAELARISNVNIDVLCVEHENDVRVRQGWKSKEQSFLKIQAFPKSWLAFVCRMIKPNRDCVHVFAGPFGSYKLTLAFFIAVLMGCRTYLLTEPYSPIAKGYFNDDNLTIINIIKSKARPVLYRLYSSIFKGRIEGIFAISPLAIAQLEKVGVASCKIFPFGYFVPSVSDRSVADLLPDRPEGRHLRIIFVGTLNCTKGVDLLVEAASILSSRGVSARVDVYGYGDKSRFGLDTPTVKYRGTIPFGHAQSVMENYDLFVLPSRYDGWGVVVNEAVLAGLPVVCSSRVGASTMIRKWGCGIVYEPHGASDLAEALEKALSDKESMRLMREACYRLQPKLSPEVAARYMFDVINRDVLSLQCIENPWY